MIASHLVAPVLVKSAEPVNVPMTAEDALVGGLQIRSLAMAFCLDERDRQLLLRVGAQLVAAGWQGAIGVGT